MLGLIGSWFEIRKLDRKERKIRALVMQERRILQRDAEECAKIALAFNNRYCHATEYVKDQPKTDADREAGFGVLIRRGYRWMCPDCNQIHEPVRFCAFGGMIYPRCCKYPEGRRHDMLGKNSDLRRPLGWCGPDGLYLKMIKSGLRTIG